MSFDFSGFGFNVDKSFGDKKNGTFTSHRDSGVSSDPAPSGGAVTGAKRRRRMCGMAPSDSFNASPIMPTDNVMPRRLIFE